MWKVGSEGTWVCSTPIYHYYSIKMIQLQIHSSIYFFSSFVHFCVISEFLSLSVVSTEEIVQKMVFMCMIRIIKHILYASTHLKWWTDWSWTFFLLLPYYLIITVSRHGPLSLGGHVRAY